MRYEKPTIVDLGAVARASGQETRSCMSGTGPANQGVCGAGITPTWDSSCTTGPDAGDCAGGSAAGFTCLSGVSTFYSYECAAGTGGAAGSCTAGPSFA